MPCSSGFGGRTIFGQLLLERSVPNERLCMKAASGLHQRVWVLAHKLERFARKNERSSLSSKVFTASGCDCTHHLLFAVPTLRIGMLRVKTMLGISELGIYSVSVNASETVALATDSVRLAILQVQVGNSLREAAQVALRGMGECHCGRR